MLWSICNSYLRYLDDINQAVDQLEDRLQRAPRTDKYAAAFSKSLVFFTTALETTELMLNVCRWAELLDLNPIDADLLMTITENRGQEDGRDIQ
jgi:magnesium transporter